MRNSRKIAATALAGTLLATAFGVAGANAESSEATFEITAAGGLNIDAPDGDATNPVNLGSVSSGSTTFAPTLGTVTVTDQRGALVAAWTATATGSDFDLQGAGADPASDANQRVAAAAISYSATPNVDLGTGTATPTVGTLAVGGLVAYAGSGNNTVSWNPTLTMTLLPTQVAGVYRGTVTHSLS